MAQIPAHGNKPRVFRRGEVIFSTGDDVTDIYMIQSGLVSLQVARGDKSIEVIQVGANQVLGEEALWGAKQWSVTAVANNDVRVLPLSLEQAQALLNQGGQIAKVYIRGLLEKLRAGADNLIEIKLENDPMPCASECIVKLFATIYTVVKYTATQKKDAMVVVWPSFKKYCQRTFLESPVRLENAVYILVKLGYARLEFIPCETDPEAPDELGFVHFTHLEQVKSFYEYYRRKSGSGREDGATEVDEANEAILAEISAWNEAGKVVLPSPDDEDSGNAAA